MNCLMSRWFDHRFHMFVAKSKASSAVRRFLVSQGIFELLAVAVRPRSHAETQGKSRFQAILEVKIWLKGRLSPL